MRVDEPVYVTKEGHEKLVRELDYLVKVRRAEVSKRIERARDMGNLDDNAEFDAAREEKLLVENRISELEDILKRIEIIEDKIGDHTGGVSVGKTVTVEVEGEIDEFTIVGSVEADPAKGLISNESPVGTALIGRGKGDEVTVKTEVLSVTYKILDIK